MFLLSKLHRKLHADFLPLALFFAVFSSYVFGQSLPKGVITATSHVWKADGIQPDGSWEIGYYTIASDYSTFTPSTVWTTYYPGPASWIGAEGKVWDSVGYPRFGKYAMAPSSTRQAVRRWTSSHEGRLYMHVDCQQLQNSANNQEFRLYRNGVLEIEFQKSRSSHHLVFSETCIVQEGDKLDFVIDSLGNNNSDWTHVTVALSTEAPFADQLFHFPLDERNDLPTGWAPHGVLYDRRNRVADYSGSDNHAVLVNMDRDLASVSGIYDQARFFDGLDDHLLLEESNLGDGLEEITVSAWIRPSSKAAYEGVLSSTGGDHIGLSFAPSNEAQGLPVKFSAKSRSVAAPDGSCPVDEWSHVVGVWKAGEIHKLYLNGRLVAQHENPGGGALNLDEWLVGSDRLLAGRYYEGRIDEVRVMKKALADWEVRDLYRRHATFPAVAGNSHYFRARDNDLAFIEPGVELGSDELTIATWLAPFTKVDNAAAISSLGNDFFGLLHSGYGEGRPIEFRAKSARVTGADYTVPNGEWSHVVGVWKSGQIQKLYLNGVEIGDNPSPPSGTVDISRWVVGRDRQSPFRNYHGLIDDLTILPHALDAAGVDVLYRQNLGPQAAGPVLLEGFLRWDYYYGFREKGSIEELVSTPAFFQADYSGGYHTGFLDASATEIVRNSGNQASHLRGYIEAPETGDYTFWLAGRASVELSLSPDEQKYTKRLIAKLSPEIGTANGVDARWNNRWDRFVSQQSEAIHLVQGEFYYIDVLLASGEHAAVAWTRPNGEREPIPSEFLTPYVLEITDKDDDYLPDVWEDQYGLDKDDKGGADIAKQGERGDFDSDGLSNREEYLLGSDPSNPDTDGDGLSDFAEVRSYGTNPTVSDVVAESVVSTVAPTTVMGLGNSWTQTATGGVITESFRGEGEWSFTLPSDGYWVLEIEGKLHGNLRLEEALPIHINIDGYPVARNIIEFQGNQPGTFRILTPRLTGSDSHELGLFVDNYSARRSLEVTSLKVIDPGGLDTDSNGMIDWVESELAGRSRIYDHVQYSHISPAFVEGLSPASGLVDLTAITRSGEVNRKQRYNDQQWGWMLPGFQSRLNSYQTNLQQQMRAGHGRMEGYQVPHAPGPGHRTWYSNVELRRNEAVGYVAQFENLGTAENRILIWQPYNVIDGGTMVIPVGSNLLLGAWVQDWDWQTVSLTIDGQSYSFPAAETHVELFDTAGTYTVSASHPGGQTGTLTVEVRAADFRPDVELAEQRFLTVDLPNVASDLTLDSGGEIHLDELLTLSPGGSQTTMGGIFPGFHRTATRISETGPILDIEEVTVVGASDALRNDADRATGVDDGLVEVHSPLLITHLPQGATVRLTIFRAGVTFLDGTTIKDLTATDFDQWGVADIGFLFPVELAGAYCHYIDIYDANGVRIWNSTN